MGIVALDDDVLITESEEIVDLWIQMQRGQRAWLAAELLARLFDVIEIQMRVAESMYEFTGLQAANLRHHHREQRIGCDVERDTEKNVSAALIELARQPALRHIELEECMARRERHLRDIGHVPG